MAASKKTQATNTATKARKSSIGNTSASKAKIDPKPVTKAKVAPKPARKDRLIHAKHLGNPPVIDKKTGKTMTLKEWNGGYHLAHSRVYTRIRKEMNLKKGDILSKAEKKNLEEAMKKAKLNGEIRADAIEGLREGSGVGKKDKVLPRDYVDA